MELLFILLYNKSMELDLNEIAIFSKVVELGSFTRAAQQLNMPNSTVSAKVSNLEKRLGIILIRRTTRKLFVTPEGRRFFEKCTQSLDSIREAEAEITTGQAEAQGLLRITSPVEFGSVILPKVIEKFKLDFPKITFDIFLSDRSVDLISEGFDLAIRAGNLKDSSLVAKKLGDIYFAAFASPSYLKKAGYPQSPKDLRQHSCLQFAPLGTESWKLKGSKGSIDVPMKKQFLINEVNVLKVLTMRGLGISLLPTFLCGLEVRSGKLVRVLDDWKANVRPVHFLYSGQRHLSPKVNAFVQIGTEIIRDSLQNFEL